MKGGRPLALVLLLTGLVAVAAGFLLPRGAVSATPVVAVRGVSPDATSDNGQRKLARADDGTLYIAYSAPTDGVEQAHLSFSLDDAQTWKPEITLGQPDIWSDLPAIAAGSGGRLDAVWVDYTGVGQVWYTSMQNRAWTEPVKISPGDDYAGFPVIALVDNTTHVLWYAAPPDPSREHGSAYEIHHTMSAGSGWSSPVLLSGNSDDALNPSMAASPDGTLDAAWFQIGSTTYGAQHAKYAQGGWAPPETISPLDQTATGVSLDAAPDGSLHLVWEQANGRTIGVNYARRTTNGWSEPESLSDTRSQDPVVAVDGLGRVAVLWSDTIRIRARVWDGAWSAEADLGAGTNPTVLSGDRILAAWTRPAADSHELVTTYLNLEGGVDWLGIGLFVTGTAAFLAGIWLVRTSGRRSGRDAGDGEDRAQLGEVAGH